MEVETLPIARGKQAGQMLAARRVQKHYERIAQLYRQKVRIAQLEAFMLKIGLELPLNLNSFSLVPSLPPY